MMTSNLMFVSTMFSIVASILQLTGSYSTVFQVQAIFAFTASALLILIYMLKKHNCGTLHSDIVQSGNLQETSEPCCNIQNTADLQSNLQDIAGPCSKIQDTAESCSRIHDNEVPHSNIHDKQSGYCSGTKQHTEEP